MTEAIDRTPIDKSDWGDGPWQHEPDRVEFEASGLPCLLLRGPHGGWCGYAAVPPGHPFHGKHCDADEVRQSDGDVHGGLTYADKCDGSHICHIPKAGEPDDVWWFGFDCAHSGDISPKYDAKYRTRFSGYEESYKTVEYVRRETESLARQLAAVHAASVAQQGYRKTTPISWLTS